MMDMIHFFHKAFFRTLTQAGASFNHDPMAAGSDVIPTFACHCGKTFTTPQGLACHKRKQHGVFAPEREMMAGTTCPECLKFFWTKQRLYQHLSYISRRTHVNACYQALKRRGFVVEPEVGAYHVFPTHVRGLARVETLQTSGPRLPFADVTQQPIATLEDHLAAIEEELYIEFEPTDPAETRAQLREFLKQTTLAWFDDFCAQQFDEDLVSQLPDRWLSCLFEFDAHLDIWIEAELLGWGEQCLADLTDGLMDGVAERLIEEAFTEMAAELPRQQLLYKRSELLARWTRLQAETCERFEHRAVKTGNATNRERALTAAAVPSVFEDQADFLSNVSRCTWFDLPPDMALPFLRQPDLPKVFLIAHLFSGRRREGDVHERLHFWAEHRGIHIVVLSLDTANSVEFGNLHHRSTTWGNLIQLYSEGRIAGTLTGAPCETWSSARHFDLSEQHGRDGQPGKHFPRPLRDAERVFGRRHLRPRELRQLQQGSLFFMQALLTMAWSLVTGSLYISEHPGIPALAEAASVWKTPWVLLLCLHPEVKLHTIRQWRWGCTVSKPTGLLAIRLPKFNWSMYSRQSPEAQWPCDTAIGLGPDGQFKTSAHKEYPKHLCDALAGTLIDEIHRLDSLGRSRATHDINSELLGWLKEASAQCGNRRHQDWLPDYQGG